MTNSLLEKPAKSAVGGTQKNGKRKRRYVRQSLISIAGLACVVALTQANFFKVGKAQKSESSLAATAVVQPMTLSYPMDELRKRIGAVAAIKDLRAGVFAVDLKTGKYLDYSGHEEFAAASMIKVPILASS